MAVKSLERLEGTDTTLNGLSPQEVLEQLDLITGSPLFSKSKRYPNFLRYIVERTLSGEVDQLKERTLGVEVFHRPSDYDTNSDPVVRITAGEIRKRLAQYYSEPGHEQQLRVDLPLGSYAPLFSRSEPSRRDPLVERDHRATIADAHEPFVAPEQADTTDITDRNELRALRFSLSAIAVLFTLGFIADATQFALVRHRERGLAAFWQPVFHAEAPALIVVGVHALGPDGKDLAPTSAQTPRGSMLASMTSTDMVPLSDVSSYSKITDLLVRHDHPYQTQSSVGTSFEQLQPGPVVLLGGLDNIWTLRLLAPLRFHFGAASSSGGEIQDASRPGTAWRFDYGQNARSDSRDYAIVASFFDPAIEQRVVVAAGIGKSGTVAATHFLTNTRQLQAWLSQAHPTAGGNFELVLSTEIVAGEQGPPRVVASYIW